MESSPRYGNCLANSKLHKPPSDRPRSAGKSIRLRSFAAVRQLRIWRVNPPRLASPLRVTHTFWDFLMQERQTLKVLKISLICVTMLKYMTLTHNPSPEDEGGGGSIVLICWWLDWYYYGQLFKSDFLGCYEYPAS